MKENKETNKIQNPQTSELDDSLLSDVTGGSNMESIMAYLKQNPGKQNGGSISFDPNNPTGAANNSFRIMR